MTWLGCRMGNVMPYTVVEGPEAWTAADYTNPSQYIHVFSASDLAELDAAVSAAAKLGKPIQVGAWLPPAMPPAWNVCMLSCTSQDCTCMQHSFSCNFGE